MTDADTHPWTRSVAMLDLAGTIREAGPLGDDELRAALAGVPIHAGHDLQAVARAAPNRQAWWYATDGDDRLFDPPTTPAERDAVADAWWRLVRAHPVAWLEHRARVFAVLVGLAPSRPAEPVRCSFLTLDEQRAYLHFDATPSPVQRGLAAIFDALGYTPLYRPIVYLALAALLLVRRRRAHVALLASGVLYELGLFVAAPSTDYRYSHWMIVTVLIAAVAAAAETVPAWRRAMASS